MISVTELRKGVTFESDGQIWRVLEYDHYKPGRGAAYIRTKLRNLRTKATVNRTFMSGERVQEVRLDRRSDTETYEQPALHRDMLEEVIPYLKEGTSLGLEFYEGEVIGIDLPITVELEVTSAPPGFAGDTATGATKQATLETGLRVQVPLFVQAGDVVRVDTRTGKYLTRV